MWVFDYRTFWDPEVDSIKVWFNGVLVGELYKEPAARELQARLEGTSIGPGDPDPVSVVEPATAPPIADAAPAPEPSASADPAAAPEGAAAAVLDPGTPSPLIDPPLLAGPPEFVRITGEGPLHNLVGRVLGYRGRRFRIRVVTEGPHCGSETAVRPEHCVPHVASGA